MRKIAFILLGTSLAAVFIFSAKGEAHAYSVNSGTPAEPAAQSSFNFNILTAPFEGFIKSIRSVGSAPVPAAGPQFNPPAVPQGNFFASTVQSAFGQFDNWLYGIIGFHISSLFFAVLNIFSWILGVVKGGVDWLRGLLNG